MSFKKVNIFSLENGLTGLTSNYDSINMIYDYDSNQLTAHYSDGTSKSVSTGSGSTSASTLTINDLRDLTNESDKTRIYVLGYSSANDGGGGEFYWDASSTSTVDDGIIFSATNITTGRWKRIVNKEVDVKWFGAKGDGTTDDILPIKKAINYADTNNKQVLFPNGSYLIKGQLYIKNVTLIGVPRKSKIIIASDFTFTESIEGRNYSCVLSNDFQGAYTAFANEFYIRDLDFELRLTSSPNGDPNLLGLANVKRGEILNCHFKVIAGLGSTLKATAIDLWACVKNLKISNCRIDNLNEAIAGGSIWIRNITNSGSNTANINENIEVENCYITHATKDEPVAVYGVQGLTKNVLFRNIYVEGLSSSQDRSVLVSAFPLNNNSSQGIYAAVDNIRFIDCVFKDYYFTSHLLRIGQSGLDAVQKCDNILVENCLFDASKSATGTSYVVRNVKCVGNNVKAINNSIIINTGATQNITYGISGFDVVSGNYLKGKLSNGIISSKMVNDNNIDSVIGIGVLNCDKVINNIIKANSHGILITSQDVTYSIDNNYIECEESTGSPSTVGIYIQKLSSLNPAVDIKNNFIKMNYIGNYAIRREGSGAVRVLNNTVVGNGPTAGQILLTNPGTELTTRNGNIFYGFHDRRSSASTQSGNGVLTSFNIAHGLGATPTVYDVKPTSLDAANIQYFSANTSALTVFYAAAPTSGTSNLSYIWWAEK